MAGLRMQLDEKGSRVTVRLEGSFDASAAVELRKVLEALDARKVLLDFSGVRNFVDLALGVLSRELDGRPIEMEVVGLQGHHERLFEYMFCGHKPRPKRAYYQPEEILLN